MIIFKSPRPIAYAAATAAAAALLGYFVSPHPRPIPPVGSTLGAAPIVSSMSAARIQGAAPAAAQASPLKTYQSAEFGFSITVPSDYSISENSSGVSIGAPATNTQPAMDIEVAPGPCDAQGNPTTNPTDYVKANFGATPKFAFDASRSNAVVIDRAKTFSLDDPTANKGPGRPVYSKNIVGYKTFREMYIFRGCSMYKASYFVGDAARFDDALMTFSFPATDPGIPETQAPKI